MDEVANLEHKQVIKLLWDLEKFYDNISIPILLERCAELEYPLVIYALGILMHMAPRIIKAHDCYMMVGIPFNGIIAGCTQSTTFAKVLLMDVMQTMYTMDTMHAMDTMGTTDTMDTIDTTGTRNIRDTITGGTGGWG